MHLFSLSLKFQIIFSINIPTSEELIANHLNDKQLANSLGANSLIYLSVDGLKTSVQSGIREKQEKLNQKKPIGKIVEFKRIKIY